MPPAAFNRRQTVEPIERSGVALYTDPILPRAHPNLLQQTDYDPFRVMPVDLTRRPRVWFTREQLVRAKGRLRTREAIDVACVAEIESRAGLRDAVPDQPAAERAMDDVTRLARQSLRLAVLHALDGDAEFRAKAIAKLRFAATHFEAMPWSGYEAGVFTDLAGAYDLLAADGLDTSDDALARAALESIPRFLVKCGHRRCNNHNAFNMLSRLAVGVALGERHHIHDALHGLECGGQWRYGLIHLLRHDFLADGMQWEGSMSYHMLVVSAVCQLGTILENVGVDIFRRPWPATRQDEGFDEHRDYGPRGEKRLQSAFDAFFFQAFPNGDYSNLHDQILGNIRGAWVWWAMINKAWETYREPRYAWLLYRMNRLYPSPAGDPRPVWFRAAQNEFDFIRFESRDVPEGRFDFTDDVKFALAGSHAGACSYFPLHGSVMLRSEPVTESSSAAYIYFGPHSAGHRSPGTLHLDIHAHGKRVTHAPHLFRDGYGDPRHLTWVRTTIAHNTVTVDEASMFPYDFETESLWEYDRWRDTISESRVEALQTGGDFKAVRVTNEDVYAGVTLDRAVILTGLYLVDVYRVTSEAEHQYDWAAHVHGEYPRVNGATNAALGDRRGYRHLTDAWAHPATQGAVRLPVVFPGFAGETTLHLDPAASARLIIAKDPPPDERTPIGDFEKPAPRTAWIVRARAKSALFVSVWSFGGAVESLLESGAADADVMISTRTHNATARWRVPRAGEVNREIVR